MSYFRRIINRTLGPGKDSVRPAVSPDSILESPTETKLTPASRKRNYPPPENDVKDELAAVPASVKGDSLEKDVKEIETRSEPEKPQESSIEVFQAIEPQRLMHTADLSSSVSDISVTKQPAWSERPYEQEGSTSRVVINPSMNSPSIESGSAKEIHVNDGIKIVPIVRSFATDNFKVVTSNKIRERSSPAPAQPPRSLQEVAPLKEDTLFTGSRTGGEDQQKYPSLLPTGSIGTKYLSNILPSEETVVTINIGKIEVRAEPQAEPAKRPKHKFSPSLSLADYLKMRSDGRIG